MSVRLLFRALGAFVFLGLSAPVVFAQTLDQVCLQKSGCAADPLPDGSQDYRLTGDGYENPVETSWQLIVCRNGHQVFCSYTGGFSNSTQIGPVIFSANPGDSINVKAFSGAFQQYHGNMWIRSNNLPSGNPDACGTLVVPAFTGPSLNPNGPPFSNSGDVISDDTFSVPNINCGGSTAGGCGSIGGGFAVSATLLGFLDVHRRTGRRGTQRRRRPE